MIDLKNQARQGEAFVAQPASGGTGVADGTAQGVYVEAVISPNATSAAVGACVVADYAQTFGRSLGVREHAAPTERIVGIVVDGPITNAAPGRILAQGVLTVLTTGTIALLDPLYPSATAGRLTATRPPGATTVGFALAAASGTSSALAYIDVDIATTGLTHRRLLDVPGIREHTDLLRTLLPVVTGAATGLNAHGTARDINDVDDTTWINIGGFDPRHVLADLGSPRAVAALRVYMAVSVAGTTTRVASIKGSNTNNYAGATVVATSTINIGSIGAPQQTIATWAPATYRYWWFDMSGWADPGNPFELYDWQLFEDSGAYAYVTNPDTGQGSLLNAALLATAGASGPAGGDLAGTYPNPTVDKVQGVDVSAIAPAIGQILRATGATTASWQTLGAGVLASRWEPVGYPVGATDDLLYYDGDPVVMEVFD